MYYHGGSVELFLRSRVLVCVQKGGRTKFYRQLSSARIAEKRLIIADDAERLGERIQMRGMELGRRILVQDSTELETG